MSRTTGGNKEERADSRTRRSAQALVSFPDLLLLDVLLPGANDVEILREGRK